ncbi:hypothetical protein J2X54_000315 [Duganella sp. 3397]|uniref:cysteine-rich CWC family protein n=1 Tax=Duganella sp. 3397 TaxID=2817732 RepID=UPI00285A70BC|nr:cysteine-rich CWC family protein [Duganella sp. 3397]MDR7047880.1 hypothetical protein [Duganella sp. 3397]
MSTCARCGATFSCAMADADTAAAAVTPAAPCWCTYLPPAVPVPDNADAADQVGCWCPACLQQHIASLPKAAPPAN